MGFSATASKLSERMKLVVQRENQRALASALRLSEQMMNHENQRALASALKLSEQMMNHENQRALEHLELLKVSWRYT